MRYAILGDEPRAEATPGARARCPACNGEVRAKCGRIVTHHWAHLSADCDDWAEPDTPWHRDWQRCAPPDRREVVLGGHRADLLDPKGMVVELQHSSISPAEIEEREAFYGFGMVWVFDVRAAVMTDRLTLYRRDWGPDWRTFRWKHAQKSISFCNRAVFLDLGDGWLLELKTMHVGPPCRGSGIVRSVAHLRERIAGEHFGTWLDDEFERIANTPMIKGVAGG